jgi:thiosulfate/3-mercaptopyruvate sulfurtransferase
VSAPRWTTLVSADDLRARLGDPALAVVDCRFSLADPGAGEAAYAAAHVPGAHYAHLDRDLSGPHAPGAGRHPWPAAEAFHTTLGRWGIASGTQVVAYDDGDGAFAARLWWLLRAMGHPDAAVLDGGWRQWVAAGHPVEATVPADRDGSYGGRFDAGACVDADGVRAHLSRGGLLLDARAPERFRGEVEPIDRVAGHVPGACNRPYAANLDGGRFKARDVLRREFVEALDGRAPQDVVAMCGSGVTACHHLLAMAHAGLPGARLYAGSWSGWIEDPARPVGRG